MPIQPFVDRPKINLDYSRALTTVTTGSSAFPDVSQFIQGVSVKTSKAAFSKLTPFISSNGFPTTTNSAIDHSVDIASYGNVTLFENSTDGILITPYQDIATLNDPVKFINDDGLTAYPQVMLSPDWLDPGAMNGIIEPLSVRGTIAGASIESPYVAHTIKASVSVETTYAATYYSTYYGEGGGEAATATADGASTTAGTASPFEDSQDISLQSVGFILSSDQIAMFGESTVKPFNDTTFNKISNDLTFMSTQDFTYSPGVGIISKEEFTIFNFEIKKSVNRGLSGIRTTCGVESIAFGGLFR